MEALGNDQNYREVVKDQHGQTDFRFRYSLQARSGGYDGPRATTFGRGAATPLLTFRGRSSMPERIWLGLGIAPSRAVATCLKPADDPVAGGHIVRLIETAGLAGPLTMDVNCYRRAIRTDLLERDQEELKLAGGRLTVDLKPYGVFAARLLP